MTAKHTPGPWAHHNTPTPFIYVNASRLPICQIYTSTAHGQSMGEQFANAHLIAAAPELLEALREIFHDVKQGAIPNDDDEWWKKASTAIAKATGEQT